MNAQTPIYLVVKGWLNKLLTYIPNYEDIFINNTREQAYIASLMFENLRRKKAMESSE